jgi:peptidoglycan/LPS O-acetylase OafA/YrhL
MLASDYIARKRIPALDSIRGIAIVAVMVRHAWPNTFPAGGFAGVDLFFVLSGFLITGILLGDEQTGTVSYRRFYLNRVLRLYPALVAMLAISAVVIATADPVNDRSSLPGGLAIGLFYVSDLLPTHALPEYGHLWTLAIEEQFYLLWPVLLISCARRGWLKRLGWGALAVTAAALLLSGAMGEWHYASVADIYPYPTTWAIGLACGCALAIGTVRVNAPAPLALGAALLLAATCFAPNTKNELWGYVGIIPAVSVLGLVLVSNAASPTPLKILLNPALRWLGRISYAVYLWDYPFENWFPGVRSIPLAIAAATLSYYVVERWFLKLRRHAPAASRVPGSEAAAQPATPATPATPARSAV